MEEKEIHALYTERYEKVLVPLAKTIEDELRAILSDTPHIDRITARSKGIDRFVAKATKLVREKPKYSDPINQIQDQIGARITCFYLSDVEEINTAVIRYFKPIEEKLLIPESENEFGYVGKHFVLHIPSDCTAPLAKEYGKALIPKFFELQIKTLFQHAWSEASHDLSYKPAGSLTTDQKRKVAFTAAQAWGADMIFNELNTQLS
jgi:putative GTP pyrophosphokinase